MSNFMNSIVHPSEQPRPLPSYLDNNFANTYRPSTVDNPMMNIQVTEYNSSPQYADYYRYATTNTTNSKTVKNNVESNLISGVPQNPEDFLFGRNNSQRQWYSVPSGSVPNDQTAFAENLYGREYVCKAGSIWMRYGLPFTEDSLTCTGYNNDGLLTGFGELRNTKKD